MDLIFPVSYAIFLRSELLSQGKIRWWMCTSQRARTKFNNVFLATDYFSLQWECLREKSEHTQMFDCIFQGLFFFKLKMVNVLSDGTGKRRNCSSPQWLHGCCFLFICQWNRWHLWLRRTCAPLVLGPPALALPWHLICPDMLNLSLLKCSIHM